MTFSLLKIVVLVVLLVVVGVIYAFFWIKGKIKGTIRQVATTVAVASQPERIHLERDRRLDWVDRDKVGLQVAALRALGFKTLGNYRIPEMRNIHLVGLGHPGEGFGAVVYEDQTRGTVSVDVAAVFRDGTSVTVTTSPPVQQLEAVAGIEKIHLKPGTAPKKLLKTLHENLDHDPIPIHPKNFVSVFEKTYAEEQARRGELDRTLSSTPSRDPDLDTACAPLFRALAAHNLDAVRAFTAQGIRPEGRNRRQLTPLMAAIDIGELPFVRALLDAGADVNALGRGAPRLPDMDMSGAISKAVEQAEEAGDEDARKFFQGFGGVMSALGAGESWQQTPLSLAIECGVPEIVEAILTAGGRLAADDTSPIELAVEVGDPDVVRVLLRRSDEVDNEALIYAAGSENLEMVRLLLDAGADPDSKSAGQTAIIAAAEAGAVEIVGVLSPLVKPKYRKKAEKILSAHVDEERTGLKDSLVERLKYAAMNGRTPMVRKLLHDHGVDPDILDPQDYSEATALMLATRYAHLEIMKLLIAAGADVNHEDHGESIIATASHPDYDDVLRPSVLRLLVDSGARYDHLEDGQRAVIEGALAS